jgi:hypothetical protein
MNIVIEDVNAYLEQNPRNRVENAIYTEWHKIILNLDHSPLLII